MSDQPTIKQILHTAAGIRDKAMLTDGDRILELEAELVSARERENNLAMLVRRLCRKHPSENLVAKAVDYLKRAGLGGSILRDSEGDPITLATNKLRRASEREKELERQVHRLKLNLAGPAIQERQEREIKAVEAAAYRKAADVQGKPEEKA